MKYYDIKISFNFEIDISYEFIYQLIKMSTNDSSNELLIWFLYRTSETYICMSFCVNTDKFNLALFLNTIEIIFSNFFEHINVEYIDINTNYFLTLLIQSIDFKLNGTHSINHLS